MTENKKHTFYVANLLNNSFLTCGLTFVALQTTYSLQGIWKQIYNSAYMYTVAYVLHKYLPLSNSVYVYTVCSPRAIETSPSF